MMDRALAEHNILDEDIVGSQRELAVFGSRSECPVVSKDPSVQRPLQRFWDGRYTA
jgi:hypothetical protein